MSGKPEIVVIGASEGGFDALKHILSGLSAEFPLPVLAVVHIGGHNSYFPKLLQGHSRLALRHARDGEPLEKGSVLFAPADHHLLVERGHARVTRGPTENFTRPAIDPLFRSAALAYGKGVVGVVLSGNLDDGTVGLQAIKAYGGIAAVQDPASANAPGMPQSALDHVDVDFCEPLDGIAGLLAQLAARSTGGGTHASLPEWIAAESRLAAGQEPTMEELKKIAQPSTFTCPECHGSLWEIKNASPQRFRCHIGHGYTAQALAAAQQALSEEAIWAAVRALHEKEMMLRRFAQMSSDGKRAQEHEAAAEAAARHADTLRKMINSG